jgi:SAM-dependent methyltransferase
MLRECIKWQLFPGLNLHARLRYRKVAEWFSEPTDGEERLVLDAGCGNGMLAYKSFLKGNRVLGVSIKEGEVVRNKHLFNEYLRIPERRLEFRRHSLYDAKALDQQFDEIICTEVLEHIERDEEVCRTFFEILKPGGILHLCCPNAEHPDHRAHVLDESESGGHVRAGYSWNSYRALLEPMGFEVSKQIGLGGPLRQACNKQITRAQDVGRLPLGLATFAVLVPLVALDVAKPRMPYSLYVMARKPTCSPQTAIHQPAAVNVNTERRHPADSNLVLRQV